VVIHAQRLADAYGPLADLTLRVESTGAEPAPVAAVVGRGPVLLHVTDRLFGSSPEAAARSVEHLAGLVPTVLSLHDIPQPEEGEDWFRRRRRAYRRFAAAAERVVVASRFERDLLLDLVDDPVAERVRVIPLPLERRDGVETVRPASEVALLGFLYPGKGVEDVVDAVAGCPRLPRLVVNYGAPAPGHEDHVEVLIRYAAERDVEVQVTGFVPDRELDATLRQAGLPVAPHRHISASGSVGSWVGAGRRPVVRSGGWARELAARVPGAITVADRLPEGLAAAVADPTSTWLADDVEVGPSWAQAARAHLDVLEELT
jgi:glycosyltransferase involved in cell wall biosynthesis